VRNICPLLRNTLILLTIHANLLRNKKAQYCAEPSDIALAGQKILRIMRNFQEISTIKKVNCNKIVQYFGASAI